MTFERNCDQCRGTGVSSLFAGRCFECGGTGQDPIARLLRTHEGACTLGERIAKKEQDYEVLHARFKGSKVLLEALDKARTVSRNPCAHCGSFQLKRDWAGSAYCSRACVEWVLSDPADPLHADAMEMLRYHDKVGRT